MPGLARRERVRAGYLFRRDRTRRAKDTEFAEYSAEREHAHAHAGAACLSLHPTDVQACSGPKLTYFAGYNDAERQATAATGARYIDTTPWFCSAICTDVIGRYQPYWGASHLTATYATVLGQVLAEAIDLNSYSSIAASPAPSGSPSSPPTASTG